MSTLDPFPGFDWNAVAWEGPDELPGETCSYCGAPIAENSLPLILWKGDGSAARFCDACMERWWRFPPRSKCDDDG